MSANGKKTVGKAMIGAITDVASTESGRLVLGQILDECHMHEDLFHADHHTIVAYNLGRRAIGEIINDLLGFAGPYRFADCETAYAEYAKQVKKEQELATRKKREKEEDV